MIMLDEHDFDRVPKKKPKEKQFVFELQDYGLWIWHDGSFENAE